MKKEYHLTITRKDRIYLVIFVTALLGWELVKLALPLPNVKAEESVTKSIAQQDSTTIERSASANVEKNPQLSIPEDEERHSIPKTPISITTASVDQLVALGFSKKVAFNIQKYISVGGQIKDEKSLKRIYGIDTNSLSDILPFIIFPAKESKDSSLLQSKEKKEFTLSMLDLNVATEEDLDKLPGIGLVLADRILKFRTSLGGFTTIDQLKDCYGITPETLEKIKPRLNIIQPAQQFSINSIDPKSFNHPYLPKKIMWMIPNYIKNHGAITNEEELRKVFPPDSNWCEKLLPYIRYE
jgi:competence protein ComEA